MKSVFISGASRGIGRAIALLYAKNGYEVAFSYCNHKEAADSLVKEISEFSTAHSFCADLSDSDQALALSQRVLSAIPSPDVLVNNAGVSSYGLFQDVTLEEYDRVFSVNVKGAFFLTRELCKPMLAKKSGSIVNISSIWGQTGASCEVLYSASKAALIGFTKALAKELAPSGIRVNALAPGVVDTDMMASFSFEEKRAICDEIPMGRFASPEEIASLALYLSEPGSSFITGQVFSVNGGQYC